MNPLFYVYELTDTNGIPFYVGKGMKKNNYDRLSYHKNSWHHNKNRKLTNKIKKLNCIFNTKIVKTSSDEKECLDLEMKLIENIGLKNLCNLTYGGEGISGYNHTKKTKVKMSKLAKTPKRLKISISNFRIAILKNTGKRKLSQQHNKIVKLYKTKSICQMCKILDVDFNQLQRYLKEISLFIRNKNRPKISEKTRQKLSDSHKGILGKAVFQYDKNGNFIQEFPSISSACSKLKKPNRHGDISSCCLNKPNRHTAFGYKWKYKQ